MIVTGFKDINGFARSFNRFFAITEFNVARSNLLVTTGNLNYFFLSLKD
jgi:hypothetical protein